MSSDVNDENVIYSCGAGLIRLVWIVSGVLKVTDKHLSFKPVRGSLNKEPLVFPLADVVDIGEGKGERNRVYIQMKSGFRLRLIVIEGGVLIKVVREELRKMREPPVPVPSQQPQVIYKEVIKEVVKVPCKYCGSLIDITGQKCPNCGAPIKY